MNSAMVDPRAEPGEPSSASVKSDEQLMVEYCAGQSTSFDELFTRYVPQLLRVMRRRLGNDADASEVVQQTFLQLHRARNDFDVGRKLRPWLMTIAYNLQREMHRVRARRPEGPIEVEIAAPSSQRTPAEKSMQAARLRAAVQALPHGQREVIELHWFQELPFPDVADALGLTLSAVKVRAHRGYKALRVALEEDSIAGNAA